MIDMLGTRDQGKRSGFSEVARRARSYRPHPLHGPGMGWKASNCYVDIWIELLTQWGCDPLAMLPFTVTLDFEGDQFTFFKVPLEDLERLYGIVVQEHAIYEPLDVHVERQVLQNRAMLVEVDAWYLPDTDGMTYRASHAKTTIGIDAIDRTSRKIGYFHNSGYYVASGVDYNGLLQFDPGSPGRLAPYAESAKRRFPPLCGLQLRDASLSLLMRHLRRRPSSNPIAAFRQALVRDAPAIAARPMTYFHAYSFNTLRQLGANFELLGQYLRWIDQNPRTGTDTLPIDAAISACDTIASESMVLEFRLARASARNKEDRGESILDVLEQAYDALVSSLSGAFPVAHAALHA